MTACCVGRVGQRLSAIVRIAVTVASLVVVQAAFDITRRVLDRLSRALPATVSLILRLD